MTIALEILIIIVLWLFAMFAILSTSNGDSCLSTLGCFLILVFGLGVSLFIGNVILEIMVSFI